MRPGPTMNRWRACLVGMSALVAFSGPVAGTGLRQPYIVDHIRLDPEARQATLGMVVDLALDEGDATQWLERKIGFYLQYVESGRLQTDRPGFARNLPVIIAFNLAAVPSAQAREYLERVKQMLEKRGYQVRINIRDPATKKMQPG